jgi:hypothetical protein
MSSLPYSLFGLAANEKAEGEGMSETKQAPGQALLELFDEATKSYAHIVSLVSLNASWKRERTIEELALSVLRAGEDVGGVLSDVEDIIKFYITASTVAGKDYDAHKIRLLLRSAKGLVRLAERIRASVPRERNGFKLSNEEIAKEFAKNLMSHGSHMSFYVGAHGLFKRLLERSREMLKEGSDNLALIGILPRRRILEYFEEEVGGLVAKESELSEPIDNDKAREGD